MVTNGFNGGADTELMLLLEEGQGLERLARAVRERQIQAYYQPMMEGRNLRIAGFESLARWQDAELGWVSPQSFIPLAERSGVIGALGRHLADLALGELGRWRATGRDIGISINVSQGQLLDAGFCDALSDLVDRHTVKPGWVTLEVTEREAFLDSPKICDIMREAAARGFRWSLDDFGAGYASYHCLVDLPLSEVKVDMRLCQRAREGRVRRILQAILQLAEALELETVAEGVEGQDLADLLRELGFDRLQGFLFAAPMPGDAARAYLEQGRRSQSTDVT